MIQKVHRVLDHTIAHLTVVAGGAILNFINLQK